MNSAPGVLMIAYYFPPMGGAGVQRTLKFAKYLPEFGWQPHILTVRNSSRLQDLSLTNEIPDGLTVTRTPILQLPSRWPWRLRHFISRWLFVVDGQIGWLPYANSAGRKAIAKDEIKVIYSTSAPYSAHLVGRHLHHQTHLPWVADFRDPWMGNGEGNYPTKFHHRINQQLEQGVFTEADRVILNTGRTRQYYVREYPELPVSKFITIPNGYDQDDVPTIRLASEKDKIFTIVHLGSLYHKTRSSGFFLKALRKTLDNGRIPQDKIRVWFIGNLDRETQGYVNDLKLGGNVDLIGYMPHQKALNQLYAADLLLLIPSYGGGSELFIPAKLYEYLACKKPILCLADPGDCADLILKANAGVIVPHSNIDQIGDQLVSLYYLWQNGHLSIEPDLNLIHTFERRHLTGQIAGIFTELAGITE